MKKLLSQVFLVGLTVKFAFMYTDDRKLFLVPDHSPEMRPTYRIKLQLYPKITPPKITVGLSKVSRSGEVKPYAVATVVK